MAELTAFQKKLEEHRARQEALKPKVHDPDLVPDIKSESKNPELDQVLDSISILDAYNQWCGKSKPSPGNRRESVMISCPNPSHPDKKPSAWMNLDKNTWFCGGCAEGGDSYDIAAYSFGYPVPGYKSQPALFVKLREQMAQSLGYTVKTTPGGTRYLDSPVSSPTVAVGDTQDGVEESPVGSEGVPDTPSAGGNVAEAAEDQETGSPDNLPQSNDPEGPTAFETTGPLDSALQKGEHNPTSFDMVGGITEREGEDEAPAPVEVNTDPHGPALDTDGPLSPGDRQAQPQLIPPPSSLTVVPFPDSTDLDDLVASETDWPTIDWEKIAPEGTFLSEWMKSTELDDVPTEYYFWLGLQALAFSCGRDVILNDLMPVRSNLYVCLYGRSGIGKSRSVSALTTLLREALPYKHEDEHSTGAQLVATPGSAEALVDSFSKPLYDPSDPKKLIGYSGVRGLVRFDELSGLVGRSSRIGSVMKPTLMEFYDGYHPIELHSRGAGRVRAEDHFAQALTTTQPRAIRELVVQADADSGFLNRWVFATGRDKTAISYGGVPFDLTLSVKRLREVRSWGAMGKKLDLTGEALAEWDGFFKREIVPLKGDENENLLTRADLTIKKMMILLAANDRISSNEISPEQVERACSVLPYLEKSYRLLGGNIGLGKFEEIRQAIAHSILKYNQKNNRSISLRELRNSLQRRNFQSDIFLKVIQTMIQLGDLKEELIKSSRGPSTVRYMHSDARVEVTP